MDILDRLAKSKFRSRFKLRTKEFEYIKDKGLEKIKSHAEDFIRDRVAPAEPINDGKQTPMRGHPVFIAQHATATCCRGCIDNAIHSAAGIQLRLECNEIMKKQGKPEPTGQAKITKGYNLPAKYVIHTVGPIVYDKLSQKLCDLLKSCYNSCLKLADKNRLKSIAFCCISTGEFHFPNVIAATIARENILEYEKKSDIKVVFNVFKDYDYEIYKRLFE